MIRGTTPLLEFILPIETGEIAEAYVTIKQQGSTTVIDKELHDCHCEERKLSVQLTQAETLSLDCTKDAEIQIRVRTTGGDALASKIYIVSVDRILKEGVI